MVDLHPKKNLADSALPPFSVTWLEINQMATYRYHFAMALHQKGDALFSEEGVRGGAEI